MLVTQPAWFQILVVALGAIAGLALCRFENTSSPTPLQIRYGHPTAWVLLILFTVLLFGLPLFHPQGLPGVFTAFYQAGSLVFGGGHVVLPLLEELVVTPGWISSDEFLAGYGAAQTVPGPMFSVASYLGTRLTNGLGGPSGALISLAGIFLPGFLLMAGILPFWRTLSQRPTSARAIAGVNAAVVGLLGAALYDPIWTTAIHRPIDLALALTAFVLLRSFKAPVLLIVVLAVVSAMLLPAP